MTVQGALSRGPMTKADKRRIQILTAEVGCLCCRLDEFGYEPAQYHHAYDRPNGVRVHDWGYPLCPWHHQGQGPQAGRGPSMAIDRRAYQRHYGPESFLVEFADRALQSFEDSIV